MDKCTQVSEDDARRAAEIHGYPFAGEVKVIADGHDAETCKHYWQPWQIVGHTGDWFHPHLVERVCRICGYLETDEH